MKRLNVPGKQTEHIPHGIYRYPQAERKEAFLRMFPSHTKDDTVNARRTENLKELRGDYH